MMKKETKRGIIVLGIIFIIYSMLMFLIPFAKSAVFYLSYFFSILALAIVSWGIYVSFIKNEDIRSRFYRFPIAKMVVVYGCIQIVLSLLLSGLGNLISWKVAIIVYVIIAGITIIGLISTETVIAEVDNQEEKLKKDVYLMRSLQTKVRQMGVECECKEVQELINKLAEELRYSDPVSNELLEDVEGELSAIIDELQMVILENNFEASDKLAKKAMHILMERNRICKLNKK